MRSLGSPPKADRSGRASWSDARFVAAEKPIASRTLADRSVLALQRGDSENGCRGESMLTLVKVQIVQVPPEQREQVNGATHACRHTADKLNNGERVAAGKDFSSGMQTENGRRRVARALNTSGAAKLRGRIWGL